MEKKLFIFIIAITTAVLLGGIMTFIFGRDNNPHDFVEEYVYIGPAQPVTVELPISLADTEKTDK